MDKTSTIMELYHELCSRLGCSGGRVEGDCLNFYEDISRHGSPQCELTYSKELDPVQIKVFTLLRDIQSEVNLLNKREQMAKIKEEAKLLGERMGYLEKEIKDMEKNITKAEG